MVKTQSTTASFCPYCQLWAFLARHTPGWNPTSLGARSTCHGKVSYLYLTASSHWGVPRLGDGTTSLCHLHHLVGPYHHITTRAGASLSTLKKLLKTQLFREHLPSQLFREHLPSQLFREHLVS